MKFHILNDIIERFNINLKHKIDKGEYVETDLTVKQAVKIVMDNNLILSIHHSDNFPEITTMENLQIKDNNSKI